MSRLLASLAGAAAGVLLAASAFLPWFRVGSVTLAGVPDPAGYFVLAIGVIAVIAAGAGIFLKREPRRELLLVGIAGVTALAVVWWVAPSTLADRAQARAEAIAIVDQVPLVPPPAIRLGYGVPVGLLAAVVLAVVGASSQPAHILEP